MNQKIESLYIHIPFCAQKCAYCDFVSFAADNNFREAYMNALYKELGMIGQSGERPKLKTIFIGGGTPSLLNLKEITQLGDVLREAFCLEGIEEFSIEANPGTLDAQALKMWKSIGVNRISMGVQSMNNDLLKKLGRIHTAEIAKASFEQLRACGFENINLDLMFGLPDQTAKDMEETLEEIIRLGPEHISAYSLKVEEGTAFDRMVESGRLRLPTEEEDRILYHMIVERLAKAGYKQYEISNFSKPGKSCKHNLVYWKGEPYYAAGMAAHGYVNGVRQGNQSTWSAYKEALDKGERPVAVEETISIEDAAFEFIMLGLRLNEGVDIKEYTRRFHMDLQNKYAQVIEDQQGAGTIVIENGHMMLTRYGMDIANTVIAEFMD